jgi:hypothetical protein
MLHHPARIILVTVLLAASIFALSGTGGTPLGGMGTGYVVFDGQKIRVSGKMPPAAADHAKTNPAETQISSSGFYLFADGTAKTQVRAVSEDAKCPLQRADFGTVGSVKFTLNAFGPYLPGEGKEKYQLATSPLAFFDVTAVNSGAAAAEAAVAMEFANGGRLGGATSGSVETGNKAISFSGSPENSYLAVDCDGTTPTFSAGAAGSFSTNGTLANSAGNLVAAKCTVPAGGTVHFKFVLAWYRTYDQENYYYYNFYNNSKEAATFGLSKFDQVRDGITSLVDRLMASNFPDWYKDRLLNNTYPLIHNSVCAQDGRCAFWEGNYGIIGTIDQGQHAAVFYTFNWPAVQWHELQYWARQQKSTGQVHHDFNQGSGSFNAGSSAMNRHLLPWDDKTHQDYFWFPNTDSWADLNCMFIFKAYELMLATGELDSIKKYWPAIKKAADRLVSQCGSGSKLPLESHSTYDRCQSAGTNCSLTPEYNGGLAITTYLAVSEIAKFCGETAAATTFYGYFTSAKAEYKQKYATLSTYGVSASVPNSGRFPEGHIAGYSWANYLCLEPIMDEDFITNTCTKMRTIQKTNGIRANGEWIFYCVDHYGGAEIAINRPDDALFIHQQDYDYYYKQVPGQVFWQSLQEGDGNTHKDSYMTAPVVWHSYFQFCGYMIDNANQRLWIRPRIPTEMNKKITNALLLNPKALGTLNYDETASGDRTQLITVAFDAPVPIKEFVLKNNTNTNTPFVLVNGGTTTATAEGSGLEKNIRVTLASPLQIGPQGVKIEVYSKAVGVTGGIRGKPIVPLSVAPFRIAADRPISYSVDADGPVSIELFNLNGIKIGTIMQEHRTAGIHTLQWNGKTIEGANVRSAITILRLTSVNGTCSRMVVVTK